MVHPDTELRYINAMIGYGVFATKLMPRGTIVWVRDDFDQTFAAEEVNRMDPHYRAIINRYAYIDQNGMHVLCWDHARFFNHSCQASCLCCEFDFEIAVRDIHPGDELTDDYGTLNLREHFPCACGVQDCRELIKPDDMERLHPVWDGKLRRIFPLIPSVPQPLWEFVKKKEEVTAVLKQPELLRSSLINYVPLNAACNHR
jgi:uncharacterized protein